MMKKSLILYGFILIFLTVSCNYITKQKKTVSTDNDEFKSELKIEVYDTTALAFLNPETEFEILANGFKWSEGPLWIDEIQSLIFSDVPVNKIYKWNEKEGLSVYLEPSGYTIDEGDNSNSGSNGLILDKENKLIICQHGDRRVARMDAELNKPEAKFITLADKYKGKKLNSPNDLVMDEEGNIYFTDPPYGLPGNKTGELGFNGVYKIGPDGEITLLIDSLKMPNGIGLSLDNKTLYINQSDRGFPAIFSYEISGDGSLTNGKVLFNFKELSKTLKGMPDGMKVHKSGNIFTSGPGGVHILSPQGKQLALIKTEKPTANLAFDSDQKYLYLTTSDLLMRIGLK